MKCNVVLCVAANASKKIKPRAIDTGNPGGLSTCFGLFHSIREFAEEKKEEEEGKEEEEEAYGILP